MVNVIYVDLKLREYKPLSGSSYIELPKWIYNKKPTVNIKNKDQKCFEYCLQYHKHKNEITHHPERVSWYKIGIKIMTLPTSNFQLMWLI